MGNPKTRITIGLLGVLVGFWLVTTPFIFSIETTAQWYLYFWGFTVLVLGLYQASRARTGEGPLTGASIGMVLIGLWIIAATVAYAYPPGATWSMLITGVVLIVAGIYEANEANRMTRVNAA